MSDYLIYCSNPKCKYLIKFRVDIKKIRGFVYCGSEKCKPIMQMTLVMQQSTTTTATEHPIEMHTPWGKFKAKLKRGKK